MFKSLSFTINPNTLPDSFPFIFGWFECRNGMNSSHMIPICGNSNEEDKLEQMMRSLQIGLYICIVAFSNLHGNF